LEENVTAAKIIVLFEKKEVARKEATNFTYQRLYYKIWQVAVHLKFAFLLSSDANN
jgi:hypothetical protein